MCKSLWYIWVDKTTEMHLFFSGESKKDTVFNAIENDLIAKKFKVINKDDERPWGGFFVIDEQQSEKFITEYFSKFKVQDIFVGGKLSPKILIVGPDKKLSWQYHFRRAEIWKVIGGEVGVVTSETDEEGEIQKHYPESIIQLKKGERHRLIGLNNWGIIAEIWQHANPNNPSDENDIVRLQDDFGR